MSGFRDESDDAPSFATLNNAEFVIDVTMSWETMILRGILVALISAGNSAKVPCAIRNASPTRPRDPGRIDDVLVNEGLASPIVEGHLVFSPNTPSWRETKDKFVTANFSDAGPSAFLSDHDNMSISEAPGVEILQNGFARSMGGSRWLNIGLVGRGFLERELRRRDRLVSLLSRVMPSGQSGIAPATGMNPAIRSVRSIRPFARCPFRLT